MKKLIGFMLAGSLFAIAACGPSQNTSTTPANTAAPAADAGAAAPAADGGAAPAATPPAQ